MNKLKEKVKQDLNDNTNVKLEFDVSKLQSNPKRKTSVGKIVGFSSLGLVTTLLLVFLIPFIASMTNVEENYKAYKKDYSIHELKKIQESTFKQLNEVDKRNSEVNYDNKISTDYKNSVINFANNSYKKLNIVDNISYSPYGLYSNLAMMALASNNDEILGLLDNTLGLTKETRKDDFIKVYNNDYFSNDYGTLQLYNASFSNTKYDYNQSYVDELTKYMVEAYELDFSSSNDVSKMLNWVNQRMGEDNYFTLEDLELDANSSLYLFSMMYFNNKWLHSFETSDTYTDSFYLLNGDTINTSYMKHTYISYGDVYDYGDYVSVYDYYNNKLKIKYLVCKNDTSSIYDLINDVNIFEDDETKKVKIENQEMYEDYYSPITINLSVPKFKNEAKIDLKQTLIDLGLSSLFDYAKKPFNFAFTNLKEDVGMCLSLIKQKNKVSFDEDGTVIKSVTMSGMKAESDAFISDTIDIKLDRPFIYVIYDGNDLPIYVGHLDNPNN